MTVEVIDAKHLPFRAVPKPVHENDNSWTIIKTCWDRSSYRWIGYGDEKLGCLWGIIPPSILSDTAYIWLYHIDSVVKQYQFHFVRHSQRQVQAILQRYPRIVGHCLKDNKVGRRWLQWLGAEFGPSDDVEGKALPFEIKAEKWQIHSH